VTVPEHDAAETIAGGPLGQEGPGSLRPFRNAFIASIGLLVFVSLFFFAYTGAFGKPAIHDLPVVVVGPTSITQSLAKIDGLKPRQAATVAAAEGLVKDRNVYGAIIVPQSGQLVLETASGAGRSVATSLASLATQLAKANDFTLTTKELAPLSANDPNGTVEFYCILVLGLGGSLAATVFGRIFGTLRTPRRLARRLLLTAIYTAAASAMITWYADGVLGALVGHPFGLFLTFWAYTAAVCLIVAGVGAILGTIAAVALTLTFVLLGNSSAGGAIPRPLLNGFYSALNPIFPHGSALTSIRGIQYFNGVGISQGFWTMAIWGAVGLTLLTISSAIGRREST
jgi:hypothetical protein